MELPKQNKSNKTGRQGIVALIDLVENELGWLLRLNRQEDDFGIDAYIDIISEEGYVTGKSMAVQVKSGNSYLVKQGDYGWKFIGEFRHLNYYLNHEIPVLIILVDLDNKVGYWEICKPENTNRVGDKWTMTIPLHQTICQSNKPLLLSHLSQNVDYVSYLDHVWKFNKLLLESGRIVLLVEKNEIVNLNYSALINFLSKICSNIQLLHELRERLDISIHGYDIDNRELYQIEEVRKWVTQIMNNVPGISYFLYNKEYAQFLKLISICSIENITMSEIIIKDYGRKGRMIEFDAKELAPLLNQLFMDLNDFTKAFNIGIQVNREISLNIAKHILHEN